MKQVSILDLTVGQVEQIEDEVGLPVNDWKRSPSIARLFTAILAAVEKKERSEYADLTLRELVELVDLDDDPKAAADPNGPGPSAPSASSA